MMAVVAAVAFTLFTVLSVLLYLIIIRTGVRFPPPSFYIASFAPSLDKLIFHLNHNVDIHNPYLC